jgi:hypothetical protein
LKNNKLKFAALVLGGLILSSWGSVGHRKIALDAAKSFTPSIEAYLTWIKDIADHASDADNRKNSDQTEAPKHYIDLDGYDEFRFEGHIIQNYDSVVTRYGEAFVLEQGILPWATINTYNKLVEALSQKNYGRAKLLAADLSHYVSDGHMPLHISTNFDGQLTGNKGIHSRYESDMISVYVDSISVQGRAPKRVNDVLTYVFDYLYQNFTYVDSLMLADNFAREIDSSLKSEAYRAALWQQTRHYTRSLFGDAASAFTDLFYSALLQAESVTSVTQVPLAISDDFWITNYSANSSTMQIVYRVPVSDRVKLHVHDLSGRVVDTLVNESKARGKHTVEWSTTDVNAGIYYLILQSNQRVQIQKVVCRK